MAGSCAEVESAQEAFVLCKVFYRLGASRQQGSKSRVQGLGLWGFIVEGFGVLRA